MGGQMTETDRQALEFLAARNGDCIGEIDTDEKLAAALVFSGLVHRGLAIASAGAGEQPTFYITAAGRDALADAASEG